MRKTDGPWDGGWRSLVGAWEGINDSKGGVYELRAIAKRGQPRPISRFRGRDTQGIIYVGCSETRVGGRIKQFFLCASARHKSGHGPGVRYAESGFAKLMPLTSIQVRWKYRPRGSARAQEHLLLERYEKRYLDLPPLNHKR